MGIIRFALALVVLCSHVGFSWNTIGALGSVQAFFILSGTYMAAVWHTKYSLLSSWKNFFLNRGLRLWPIYLILMGLTLLSYIFLGQPETGDLLLYNLFRDIKQFGLTLENTSMLLLSIVLFGQDFASVSDDLHYMLPVRQSWSIATEFLFYLTVPVLFKREWRYHFLMGFLVLMGLKLFLFEEYGWRYSYFLPFGNYGYFLLGASIYYFTQHRVVEKFKSKIPSNHIVTAILLLAIFSFTEASFEMGGLLVHFGFIGVFSLGILLSFEKTIHKLDLFLGNISYSVYLNHFMVLVIGTQLGLKSIELLLFTLVFSVSIGILSEKLVQKPIDVIRSKISAIPVSSKK